MYKVKIRGSWHDILTAWTQPETEQLWPFVTMSYVWCECLSRQPDNTSVFQDFQAMFAFKQKYKCKIAPTIQGKRFGKAKIIYFFFLTKSVGKPRKATHAMRFFSFRRRCQLAICDFQKPIALAGGALTGCRITFCFVENSTGVLMGFKWFGLGYFHDHLRRLMTLKFLPLKCVLCDLFICFDESGQGKGLSEYSKVKPTVSQICLGTRR